MRALWDDEARTFDEAADHGLRDPGVRAAWRELLRDLLPPPPARVADLGCGTGTLALLLTEEGYDVTGVDVSPEMVRRARAKAPEVEFVVADASVPPLDPASYDVVLSRHVLWAMPDPAAALERWARLLRERWAAGAGRGQLVDRSRADRRRDRRPGRGPWAVRRPCDLCSRRAYWGHEITDERYRHGYAESSPADRVFAASCRVAQAHSSRRGPWQP